MSGEIACRDLSFIRCMNDDERGKDFAGIFRRYVYIRAPFARLSLVKKIYYIK